MRGSFLGGIKFDQQLLIQRQRPSEFGPLTRHIAPLQKLVIKPQANDKAVVIILRNNTI